MQSVIDAEVVTRLGETVHENVGAQVDRVRNALWQAFAETRRSGSLSESPTGQKIVIVLAGAGKDPSNTPQGARHTYLNTIVLGKISRLTEAFSNLEELGEGYRIFNEYLEQKQKDVLLSFATRATSKTSTLVSGQSFERSLLVPRKNKAPVHDAVGWSDDKNKMRCKLVDKEIAGTLTHSEQSELEQLQTEMLSYRRKVAPLPLEDLRELHAKLLRQVSNKSK